RAAPAAIVAPFQYTQLIWGLIFGALIFGDHPQLVMLTGAVLVIGSGWSMFQQPPSSRLLSSK
ncbi:MAG: EamA/RhaT family transporter, partial [Geminicoccaceae bacterium]